jgi:hypothetical protein
VDKASGQRLLSKGSESRSTLTTNGRVELSRKRWYHKDKGSCSPLDVLVDAAEATISVGVRDLCCRLNGNARNFEKAADNLARAGQILLSGETLRQVVESEGKRVLALARSGALLPDWRAGDCVTKTPEGKEVTRVYLGSDAFTIPLITDGEKQGRRKKVKEKRQKRGKSEGKASAKARPLPPARKGSDQKYKEVKMVIFYDQMMEHRLVSVTRGDCDAAGLLMRRDAGRLDFAFADERVGNIDGGPWIINQIHKRHLPMSATGLDFYHLGENVHKGRRLTFGEENEAGREWAGQMLHAAKHEGYEPLREGLMQWRKGQRGCRRQEADRLIHYVSDRREMIRYPEFIEKGWQIGSGPTESQCRLLPDRVKGSGMRWDADNAEAVMALEAMEQSNQSSTYWKMALTQRN